MEGHRRNDDEAARDPGAHQTHSSFSEKDFEGEFHFIAYKILHRRAIC